MKVTESISIAFPIILLGFYFKVRLRLGIYMNCEFHFPLVLFFNKSLFPAAQSLFYVFTQSQYRDRLITKT